LAALLLFPGKQPAVRSPLAQKDQALLTTANYQKSSEIAQFPATDSL